MPKCRKTFLPSKMHFTEVHSVARSVHTAGTYCAITLHLELWPSRCIWHGIVGQNGQKSAHTYSVPRLDTVEHPGSLAFILNLFSFFCGKLHNSVVWVMEVRTNTTEIPYLCTKGRAESCHVPMLGHRDCYESPVLTEILKTNLTCCIMASRLDTRWMSNCWQTKLLLFSCFIFSVDGHWTSIIT